jgi:hypothetical protein
MEMTMTDDASFDSGDPAQTAQLIALNNKLRWACHSIRAVALVWIVWVLGLILWIWGDRAGLLGRLTKLYGLDPSSVTDVGYWSAFALALASWLASAVLVVSIWRLARVYLDGRVFAVDAAARLRAVALAGFAATAVDIVVRPMGAVMLSPELLSKVPLYGWFNPPDLLYLLICGFILALSVIFMTAAEIADDHARIV